MEYTFLFSQCLEWKDFYQQNGFVVIKGLYSSVMCDNFLEKIKKHANSDFSAIMNIDRYPPDGCGVREAWDIIEDAPVVAILDVLQGAPVVATMSQVIFKEVGSRYADQAWNPHQDNAYPKAKDGAYITTNLFLADSDPKNGGLYIFPESHKEGLLSCVSAQSYREVPGTNPGNTVVVPEGHTKVDLCIKRGQVIVLHGNVIHGSYPNKSHNRSRPLFSVSYITDGVSFWTGANAKRTRMLLKRGPEYYRWKEAINV